MRCVYSIVRFVPHPTRGEFVNVGIIVGSEESSEWQVRQIENARRARAVDDGKALGAVWEFLNRVGHDIDLYDRSLETLFDAPVRPSEAWLQKLHRDHRNVVQLSAPIPMVARTVDEATERILDEFIVDPVPRTFPFKKKNVALAAVRRAYRERSIAISEGVVLEAGAHKDRVDFAVTNGWALQLTQTWSFQVPDQENLAEQIKAWGWTVRATKEHGGHVLIAGRKEPVPVDATVEVEVVYVAPEPGALAPALPDALGVFEALGAIAVTVDDADQVGDRARRILRASEQTTLES